jgi:hypothetical protein
MLPQPVWVVGEEKQFSLALGGEAKLNITVVVTKWETYSSVGYDGISEDQRANAEAAASIF